MKKFISFCSFDLSCPILEKKIVLEIYILYCLVLLNSGFFNLVCFDLEVSVQVEQSYRLLVSMTYLLYQSKAYIYHATSKKTKLYKRNNMNNTSCNKSKNTWRYMTLQI